MLDKEALDKMIKEDKIKYNPMEKSNRRIKPEGLNKIHDRERIIDLSKDVMSKSSFVDVPDPEHKMEDEGTKVSRFIRRSFDAILPFIKENVQISVLRKDGHIYLAIFVLSVKITKFKIKI